MTPFKTLTILFLFTLWFASCSDTKTTKQESFTFPELVDTLKTADHYYSPAHLITPNNTIEIIQRIGQKAKLLDATNYYKYFIDDHYLSDTTNKSVNISKGFSIVVDTTKEVSVDPDEWGIIPPFLFDFTFDDEEHSRSKKQILIDSVSFAVRRELWKANRKLVRGFPVYIVNQTNNSVRVEEQEGRLMMIQEALDTSGQWKPIEVWQFSGCGNSYGGIALKPNYYLMTKVVKYKGPFETLLRLKMLNKDELIYSKPFKGSINLSQMDTSLMDRKFSPREFLNPVKIKRVK